MFRLYDFFFRSISICHFLKKKALAFSVIAVEKLEQKGFSFFLKRLNVSFLPTFSSSAWSLLREITIDYFDPSKKDLSNSCFFASCSALIFFIISSLNLTEDSLSSRCIVLLIFIKLHRLIAKAFRAASLLILTMAWIFRFSFLHQEKKKINPLLRIYKLNLRLLICAFLESLFIFLLEVTFLLLSFYCYWMAFLQKNVAFSLLRWIIALYEIVIISGLEPYLKSIDIFEKYVFSSKEDRNLFLK